MIDQKINKIYDIIINNQKLTSTKLAETGFNPNEVSFLVTNNILKRDKEGIFYLSNTDDLFSYGNGLVNYDEERAIKCFEKCLDLKSNVEASLFKLFYLNIKKNNYEQAFLYLKQNFGSDDYISDDKYYLYLLNFITTLPDEYKKMADAITFDDICTNDEKQNEIRQLSLNKEFDLALEKYNKFIDMNNGTTYHDVIVENLLDSCLIKQRDENSLLSNTIIEKNIDEFKANMDCFLEEFSNNLSNNNISDALIMTEEYLKKINKEKYLFLIVDYIELHLTYNINISFITKLLEKIINGTFVLDINLYIQKFNNEIKYNNREKALFYLDILNNAKNINTVYEGKLDGYLKSDWNDDYSISEYIESHMEQLKEEGILYLKISNENIKKLFDIVESMPINITMIGYNEIILRYVQFKNECMDSKKIYELGKDAYHSQDYLESIKYFKQLLSIRQPNPGMYIYLGMSNLKCHNINAAIKYLIMVTRLDDGKRDFTEMVNRLVSEKANGKNNNDKNDNKTCVKMVASEFSDATIYSDKLMDVVSMMNNGMTFDVACQNLDENDKNCIALDLAVDFYKQGEFKFGDYYLTIVIHSKQKSEFIRKKITEIQSDRQFYQNRVDENYEPVIKTFRK